MVLSSRCLWGAILAPNITSNMSLLQFYDAVRQWSMLSWLMFCWEQVQAGEEMHWRCRTSRLSSFCKILFVRQIWAAWVLVWCSFWVRWLFCPKGELTCFWLWMIKGMWDFLQCMTAQTSELTFSCQVLPDDSCTWIASPNMWSAPKIKSSQCSAQNITWLDVQMLFNHWILSVWVFECLEACEMLTCMNWSYKLILAENWCHLMA
jgi:hypothetical protein